MSDLVNFLNARIDEDNDVAQETRKNEQRVPGTDRWFSSHGNAITSMAPHRAVAEVEAKRRIIDEHQIARNTVTAEGDFSNAPGCATCHESDGEVIAFGYCRTLRLLALPYAAHLDYREEWKL